MTRIEIEQAVTDHLGLIRGVVIKTLKKYGAKLCEADVEDIESNTVLCLLEGRLGNYQHTTPRKLQQWIGYIAMQRCIDYLRALKKTVSLAQEPDEDSPSKLAQEIKNLAHADQDPLETLLETEFQTERRARLRTAVAALALEEQVAFTAMSEDGYSTRAYAQIEGIKESSVHTRRHRLLKNLRKNV